MFIYATDAHAVTRFVSSGTELQLAINSANPGDVILMRPGTYNQKITITRSGASENPITIRSESTSPSSYAVIDRGISPGGSGDDCVSISSGASWITLEHLRFRNCWNDIIVINNGSYLTFRNIEASGGTHFVQSESTANHHILIENTTWDQAGSQMWVWAGQGRGQWEELHHGSLGYYNGGIYGGTSAGTIVIRNNTIKNTFNGMQWWNNGPYDNSNSEIYNNLFEKNYDNGVEPEEGAFNLHIYNNIFKNVLFGIISHDKVGGGDVYFYGNIGWIDDDPAGSWTIFKLRCPSAPLHIYHNSFYYKNAMDFGCHDSIRHFNNAYYHISGGMGPSDFTWGDFQFDNDCTSKPWNSSITSRGQEAHGLQNTNPMFRNPMQGDLKLQINSPCIDKGKIIPGFTQSYQGSAPDIGAYEGEQLFQGPAFEAKVPPGGLQYSERPRIVRHTVDGSTLRIFFSWPLQSSVSSSAINLTADGANIPITNVSSGTSGRELILATGTNLSGKKLSLKFNTLPTGTNGQTATQWASTIEAGIAGTVTLSPTPTSTPSPSTPQGDLNNDHIVNSLDWSLMNSKWFTNDSTADLNSDGIVNSLDFSIMNGNWLKTL